MGRLLVVVLGALFLATSVCDWAMGGEQKADSKPDAQAGGNVTLSGTFERNVSKGKATPVTALLVPDGEKKWKATFSFKWKGKDLTWMGTAEGDFQNGKVSGVVKNETGNRIFKFNGIAKDGVVNCSHSEVKGGNDKDTGTMTIKKT